MIRYGYAGRHYPRFQPDGQGVFHWASVGRASFIPVPPGTHKRLYHNWKLYGGPYNSCFVWQNAGSAGVTPVPPRPTFIARSPERPLHWPDTERELREIIDLAMLVIDND